MPSTQIFRASSLSSSITLTSTVGQQQSTHSLRTTFHTSVSAFASGDIHPASTWDDIRRSRQPLITPARDPGSDLGLVARLPPARANPSLASRTRRNPPNTGAGQTFSSLISGLIPDIHHLAGTALEFEVSPPLALPTSSASSISAQAEYSIESSRSIALTHKKTARSSAHPYARPSTRAGTSDRAARAIPGQLVTPRLARLPRTLPQAPLLLTGSGDTPISDPSARLDPREDLSTHTPTHAHEAVSTSSATLATAAIPSSTPTCTSQPLTARVSQAPDGQDSTMPSRVPQTPQGPETFRVPQALFDAYKNNEDILLAQINELQDRLKASTKREKRLATSFDQVRARLTELEKARKQDIEAQEEELGCPICASVLVDPYEFVPCGHCVCGTCAVQWIDTQSTNHGQATCPECRDHLSIDCPIVANRPLDKIINKWIEKRTGDNGDGWDGYQDWLERKESWEAYKLVHPSLIDGESFRTSLRDQHLPRESGQLPGLGRLAPPSVQWFSPPLDWLEGDHSPTEEQRLMYGEVRIDRDGNAHLSSYSDPAGGMAEIRGIGRRGAASGISNMIQMAMDRNQRRAQTLTEEAGRQRRQQERQQRGARGWIHQGFGPSDAEDMVRQAMRGMLNNEAPDVFSFLGGMRSMNTSMAPMGGSLAVFSHFESRL